MGSEMFRKLIVCTAFEWFSLVFIRWLCWHKNITNALDDLELWQSHWPVNPHLWHTADTQRRGCEKLSSRPKYWIYHYGQQYNNYNKPSVHMKSALQTFRETSRDWTSWHNTKLPCAKKQLFLHSAFQIYSICFIPVLSNLSYPTILLLVHFSPDKNFILA